MKDLSDILYDLHGVSAAGYGYPRIEGYPVGSVIERRRYFDPETNDHSGTYFRDLVVPILDAMGVARTLVAAAGTEAKNASASPEALAAEIGEVSIDFESVVVPYRSSGDAFGQLASTRFPYLVVDVDGEAVDLWRSAMSCNQLLLPAGEHVLREKGVASLLPSPENSA